MRARGRGCQSLEGKLEAAHHTIGMTFGRRSHVTVHHAELHHEPGARAKKCQNNTTRVHQDNMSASALVCHLFHSTRRGTAIYRSVGKCLRRNVMSELKEIFTGGAFLWSGVVCTISSWCAWCEPSSSSASPSLVSTTDTRTNALQTPVVEVVSK